MKKILILLGLIILPTLVWAKTSLKNRVVLITGASGTGGVFDLMGASWAH